MIRTDFHTHSDFSGDSKASMQSMIEGAVSKGLQTICFTEHNDPDFTYLKPEEEGMFDLDTPAYIEKASQYKEAYAGKINVLHGVELGIQEHLGDTLSKYARAFPFDFIIASSHLCEGMDPYFPEFFEGRSVKDAFRSYFESIDRCIRIMPDFDVYGHLDYVVRYAPSGSKEYFAKDYTDIFESIFRYLIQNGKGIEVNSGGFSRGLTEPNPCTELLKMYQKMGGEIITIGSDAHAPENLIKHFDKIETILTHCGYRYYTVFANRKPDFIRL